MGNPWNMSKSRKENGRRLVPFVRNSAETETSPCSDPRNCAVYPW